MLAPSRPADATVATFITLAPSRPANATGRRSRPLLINVYVNIQSVNKGGIGRHHPAFAVANCVLNWRFAAVTVGNCGDCWKLRRAAGKARNMMENALSILIVIFPYNFNKLRAQTENCVFSGLAVIYGWALPSKHRSLNVVWLLSEQFHYNVKS